MTPERFERLRHQATEAHAMDRDAMNEMLDEIERMQNEILSCSRHHTQPWQLPSWAKTKADIRGATEEQLDDLMGTCHQEDGDPGDECLACYAYNVACEKENKQKEGR